MKVHFISIGGSIMHNLAIAFHKKGFQVTGSDDEIFEPAKSRLAKHGLLPENIGWDSNKITKETDAVILGMHAKNDNPELIKAKENNVRIYSFPEFIYENSLHKKRVVIAGSHGKTTITSMIMHVLAKQNMDFDYVVGSQVPGFEDSVRITENSPVIIIEGDEYLTSALDRRPKFLWYHPHLALISGIAWDHMNVFPTYEIYKKQFNDFIESLETGSTLLWCEKDSDLKELISRFSQQLNKSYSIPVYKIIDGKFTIYPANGNQYKLEINGSHNLLNMEGARLICEDLGVGMHDFYSAFRDFKGARKRLEVIYADAELTIFRDFAHAPSKVLATIEGVKNQFPNRKIMACLELHTYSSISQGFMPQYKNTTNLADQVFLYINKQAAKLKGMELPSASFVLDSFNNNKMKVFFDKELMIKEIEKFNLDNSILLLMSSGDFDKWDIPAFIKHNRH